MRLTRSRLRHAAVIAAGAALVAGSVLTPSPAQAAPIGSTDALVEQLGLATAGSYRDAQLGRMVVTVTDAGTAKSVRATGAVARKVKHSGAELARITRRWTRRSPSRAPPGPSTRSPTRWSSPSTDGPGAHVDHRGDRRAARRRRAASSGSPAAAADHLRRRRDLRRRLPLLARLQRGQRQHVLLPDRRALHQHRRDLDDSSAARSSAPGPAPASPATTTASCATPPASPTRQRRPVPAATRTSRAPAPRPSGRRSPAAAPPPACTAAR